MRLPLGCWLSRWTVYVASIGRKEFLATDHGVDIYVYVTDQLTNQMFGLSNWGRKRMGRLGPLSVAKAGAVYVKWTVKEKNNFPPTHWQQSKVLLLRVTGRPDMGMCY